LPNHLAAHEPLLLNTIAHLAGTILFAVFLYLLHRDPAGARLRASWLSVLAAVLALLWNLTSLVVIGLADAASPAISVSVAVSTSVLTLLPAVLLHISLGGRFRWIRATGYILSAVAISIHWSELLLDAPHFHRHALEFTTISFGTLTLLAAASLFWSSTPGYRVRSPLLAVAALFLFALTFIHFGAGPGHMAWPLELLAHHAGIPLALFVLLQDFRFVLLDAFLRALVNLTVGVVAVLAIFAGIEYAGLSPVAQQSPFYQGVLLVTAALFLIVVAVLGSRLQQLLTRIVFRRPDTERVLSELRTHEHMPGEQANQQGALPRVADVMGAAVVTLPPEGEECLRRHAPLYPRLAAEIMGCRNLMEDLGVEAIVPLRFSAAETRYFCLSRRPGGRPYLSEDLEALARFSTQIVEHITHFRELEVRRLASQAELRALQAQIHPHFLFNALNTLYGVIPSSAEGARNTVLNLADILRYFLQGERTLIPLTEEVRIIKAYLEVEQLRLGDRLQTALTVETDTESVQIPVLSIQPLIENAVKHGVSPRAQGGAVTLRVSRREGAVAVRVEDRGESLRAEELTNREAGLGVGLENVRRRLQLCYGSEAELTMKSDDCGSIVEFTIPSADRREVHN